eukprot:TRINITY_DN2127_c0_g1_i1.p1 TRINITY_DN2127_c0_g1~~TRINITY_DN2127_c0_g1_i1.p1  ORF type:complete len:464 (-),score=112.20 TRINITY_DN2127_c0_g1_i1:1035-2378(-)
MATLKLYTFPGNKNSFKALIAAEYVGVKIDVPPFKWGETNVSPEFLKLTPIGKIPVLQTPNGAIFESNAIARYIARLSDSGLYGSTLLEMAHVEQWIDFATNELDVPLTRWGSPLHGYGPRIKQVEEASIAAAERGLAALNTYLLNHTFLVGHKVTLADIVTVCALYVPFKGLLSADFMKTYPHVQRYFLTLVNQPNFQKIIGEVKQCAVLPTDVLPKSAALAPAAAQPAPAAAAPAPAPTKKAAEPKPAKVKEAAKPKAAEAPKAAPVADGNDEEEEAPKPKPSKSPLDSLPPSTMVMDTWKRLYSNTKAAQFREVAIKGFWDMYDPEGYSLWFCEYKYQEENQVRFVTLNKVSGFLQRMDLIRKHGFAKMLILGTDPGPYTIKGVWLFRGKTFPEHIKDECYDLELYDWKQADITDPAQKDLVSDYFEEPDIIGGLPLVEAKCFK